MYNSYEMNKLIIVLIILTIIVMIFLTWSLGGFEWLGLNISEYRLTNVYDGAIISDIQKMR